MPNNSRQTVRLLLRAPTPAFHSVEQVFAALLPQLREEFRVHWQELPYSRLSVQGMAGNCRAARRGEFALTHITGHANYTALSCKAPSLMTVHDVRSAFSGNPLRDFLMQMLWFWGPALAVKRITVISDFTRTELAGLIPFARHKIQVVHNPISTELAFKSKTFREAHPRILHMGTKPNKNLRRTAEALKGVPCTLVVIGNLPEEERALLEALDITYESRENLDYAGIVREYETCDLVCFASLYEGFGMPVVEANAVGRPVVAGNAGAIPEVAADAACLVDPSQSEAIREGILKVIHCAGYREQLVTNGLRNVQRFRPQKIARDYAAIYKEIIGEAGEHAV